MRDEPAAPSIKTVHLMIGDASLKPRYFDQTTGKLIPDLIFIKQDGSVCFETNEIGLKGARRDPQRKLAVVWGDSVVFGADYGWPCRLDEPAPGYQFLNGGIEGDPYANILRRASDFNREHPAAVNLLMLGWHPFRIFETYRDRQRPMRLDWLGGALTRMRAIPDERARFRAALADGLATIPNSIVLTMPTALNPTLLGGDLSPFFLAGGVEGFSFCGQLPYASGIQAAAYEFIVERNALTRDVCAELRIALVDLFAVFDTATGVTDFRHYFHDIVHFRPSLYREVAGVIFDAVRGLLA